MRSNIKAFPDTPFFEEYQSEGFMRLDSILYEKMEST